MTSDTPSPASKEELKAELQTLLRGAHDNGIDVNGGFACRNGEKYPDWDVVITEVEKKDRS